AKWCDEMRRRAPQSWLQYRCELMLLAYGRTGQPDIRKSLLALEAARRVPYVTDQPVIDAWFVALVAASYARAGMRDSARALTDRDLQKGSNDASVVQTAAGTLLRIGEADQAVQLLAKQLETLPGIQQRLLNSRELNLLDPPPRELLTQGN